MGCWGAVPPHSGYFLSCCIVKYSHVVLGDHLDFSKFPSFTFSPPCFLSWLLCTAPPSPPGVICLALSYLLWLGAALLCLYPCDVSAHDDFHLFVELYTELDVPKLLIKPQILWTVTLYAQISTLAFHLKEWCHCVDNLVIFWLLRENV